MNPMDDLQNLGKLMALRSLADKIKTRQGKHFGGLRHV